MITRCLEKTLVTSFNSEVVVFASDMCHACHIKKKKCCIQEGHRKMLTQNSVYFSSMRVLKIAVTRIVNFLLFELPVSDQVLTLFHFFNIT